MAEERWHLDKGIPVSLLVVLVGQFVAGIYFFAQLEARVVVLEEERAVTRENYTEQRALNADVTQRLSAIEAILN